VGTKPTLNVAVAHAGLVQLARLLDVLLAGHFHVGLAGVLAVYATGDQVDARRAIGDVHVLQEVEDLLVRGGPGKTAQPDELGALADVLDLDVAIAVELVVVILLLAAVVVEVFAISLLAVVELHVCVGHIFRLFARSLSANCDKPDVSIVGSGCG